MTFGHELRPYAFFSKSIAVPNIYLFFLKKKASLKSSQIFKFRLVVE